MSWNFSLNSFRPSWQGLPSLRRVISSSWLPSVAQVIIQDTNDSRIISFDNDSHVAKILNATSWLLTFQILIWLYYFCCSLHFPLATFSCSVRDSNKHLFSVSCIISLLIIYTLQIRKSSLKIKIAKCCLVVENFLLLKFSLGIFNFFICVTEQVLLVIIAMRLFKIYFWPPFPTGRVL